MLGDTAQKEYGDYQTPLFFAKEVCDLLKDQGIDPDIVLEPTCGIGNFLLGSIEAFNAERYVGIEISKEYYHLAKERIKADNCNILNQDFFNTDFESLLGDMRDKELLIIGNPPWVNNSNLSVFDSNNCPVKSNFKKLSGINAITGESNFDISEYMILTLINCFCGMDVKIALLCKTIVARNVFSELKRNDVFFKSMSIYKIDTKKIFDAAADGCLFFLDLNSSIEKPDHCLVYDIDSPESVISKFGYVDGKIYSNFDNKIDFEGESTFEWRQGIKHDCSSVMELSMHDGLLCNKIGEHVCIEGLYVYPLLKSSSIKSPLINIFEKYVIVTQTKTNQDTSTIQSDAPKTWTYLQEHKSYFDKRKSIIYKNSPVFSMFGVGSYSFEKYKVVVSGIYKKPLFSLVWGEKPVMIDDTCYSISFNEYNEAYVIMLLLNEKQMQAFISNISFIDSKRPYTKKVLMRIDFRKATSMISYQDLKKTECEIGLSDYLTVEMYDGVKKKVRVDTQTTFD